MARAAAAPTETAWPDERQDVLVALNRAAMAYWHRCLIKTPHALDYLTSRGWPDAAALARKFGLGYAPGRGDAAPSFVTKLLADGFPGTDNADDCASALVAAGLAKATDDGRVRDRFYGRLMFPIVTLGDAGKLGAPDTLVVGFGGRILPKFDAEAKARGRDDTPKYLNTPETVLFHKSRTLYGMPWAVEAIRASHQAIVLEGYMDHLRVFEAGFTNIVACCGTAVTPEHVQMLAKLTGHGKNAKRQRAKFEVVLMTDADAAGRRAAERGAEVVACEGLTVRIASFGVGKDPDDLLRETGADGQRVFTEVVRDAASPVLNYLLVQREQPAGTPWKTSLRALVDGLGQLRRYATLGGGSASEAEVQTLTQALKGDGLPMEASNLRMIVDYTEPAAVAEETD